MARKQARATQSARGKRRPAPARKTPAPVRDRRSTAKRAPVSPPGAAAKIQIRPAAADRWPDVERLFGQRGACGGCWCMSWRLPRRDFEAGKGEPNRRRLRQCVRSGTPPGVLAYAGDEPIGWCAIAPRSTYDALERSRVLKPIDAEPVWSVTCFFVARPWRRRGVSVELLRGACRFAAENGARIVEGYPVVPRKKTLPDVFVWTGLPDIFRRAGFREAHRWSDARPIMRWEA